jgi:signal transduction histidine kinase
MSSSSTQHAHSLRLDSGSEEVAGAEKPVGFASGTTKATAAEPGALRHARPHHLFLILAIAMFSVELLVMTFLPWLGPVPHWLEALLDATVLTVVLLPLLHRFLLRPMNAQIAQQQRTQGDLRSEVEVRKLAEIRLEQSNRELRARTHAERNARRLAEAMTEATVALNSSVELDEVLDRMLEQVQRVVPCRAVAVLLLTGDQVHVARYRDAVGQWCPKEGFLIDRFPGLRTLVASPQPYLVADAELDPEWMGDLELGWVRAILLAPLVEEGRTVGFLVVFDEQPGHFDGEKTNFVVTFAAYAAIALHRARIYEAELRARQTVETLSTTSLSLTQTLELQSVLDLLLGYLQQLIPLDRGWAALLESESRLVVRARLGQADKAEPALFAIEVAEYPELEVLLGSRQGALAGGSRDAAAWLSGLVEGCEWCWLAVPVAAAGRALGLCILVKDDAGIFTPAQMRLAEAVAAQAAVAVQNAWLFQQLRAGRERLQSLSHRLVQVQESERTFIARELHDEAGQALASLMLGLGQLERDAQNAAKVVAGVRELRQVANDVQENLHRLAMDLRPASLDHLGLVAAVDALVEKLRRQYSVAAQFKSVGWNEDRVAAEVQVSLYRIVQEALTNVVRHAQAGHVDVLLQQNDAGVILTIEDDGAGFDPDAMRSAEQMGVLGMRERCEMLGGSLIVESSPGGGTTVVAEVPYGHSNSDL